jgi:hypothetical protein
LKNTHLDIDFVQKTTLTVKTGAHSLRQLFLSGTIRFDEFGNLDRQRLKGLVDRPLISDGENMPRAKVSLVRLALGAP